MIEVKDLSFFIGGKKILNSIHAFVEQSCITVLLGANGAGKSTLLKCMAGLLPFHQGRILLDGLLIQSYSLKELSKRRSVLSQIQPIFFPFTVMEIVLMGRSPYVSQVVTKKDIDIAKEMLKKIEVYHLKDRLFFTLSGGEQQRVHIARVLAQIWEQKKAYIFLDEPTSSLDLKHQHQLFQFMQELCKAGHTVICILHDLNLAMKYTHNALVLKDGRVFKFGETQKVLTQKTLCQAYGLNVDLISKHSLKKSMGRSI